MDRDCILFNISPCLRVALYHKVKGKMSLKPRIIFDYELLYLEKGVLHVDIEGERRLLKPGQMVLFKPGKTHSFVSDEGSHDIWMPHIHFDALAYDDFYELYTCFKAADDCPPGDLRLIRPDVLGEGLGIPDIIDIPNHAEVLSALLSVIRCGPGRDPDSMLLIKSMITRILHLILTGLRMGADSPLTAHGPELEKVADFIAKHYSEPLTLTQMAKTCCLSAYHFERLFKHKYGVSPIQYLIHCRIEKAKELMGYTQMSLTSIAGSVGYKSIYAFSNAFRKKENISPGAYKKKYIR